MTQPLKPIIQCQLSTNDAVLIDAQRNGDVWTCPGHPFALSCRGGDTYELHETGPLIDVATAAQVAAAKTFGLSGGHPFAVVRGERPHTLFRADGKRFVYIGRAAQDAQERYQLGHEMTHVVLGNVFDWVHEMLAEHFTIKHLPAQGYTVYANDQIADHRRKSTEAGRKALSGTNTALTSYPPNLYADAYVIGEKLCDAAGWEAVTKIPSYFGANGRPDLPKWGEKECARPVRSKVLTALGLA